MKSMVIVDTGPLVAYLNHKDIWHRWVKKQLAEITPPLLTCEPVMAEACFVLRKLRNGPRSVLKLLDRGLLAIPFSLESEIVSVNNFMKRYRDTPISLADACLLRMTEMFSKGAVLTLDSDFRIYRKHGRQIVPTIMPERIH